MSRKKTAKRSEALQEKRPEGRPPHVPTADNVKLVRAMSAHGIPQESIAKYLKFSVDTLQKYYADDLLLGGIEANHKVAESLFMMATKGKNVAAAIFWLKARCGWVDRQHVKLDAFWALRSDKERIIIGDAEEDPEQTAENARS